MAVTSTTTPFFPSCCLCWLFWRCEMLRSWRCLPSPKFTWGQVWNAFGSENSVEEHTCHGVGEKIFHFSTLFLIPGVNLNVLLWHLCCLEHSPKYLGLFWGLFYEPLAEVVQLVHLPDCSLEVDTKFSWFRLLISADFHRRSLWNGRTVSSFGLSVSWWIPTQILPGKNLSCGMTEEWWRSEMPQNLSQSWHLHTVKRNSSDKADYPTNLCTSFRGCSSGKEELNPSQAHLKVPKCVIGCPQNVQLCSV